MRQVTAVACCFCICFAETRIQILSDDVQSVTKISGELLGARWASYFSNILRILGLFVLGKQNHLPLAGIWNFC
jgi:hypothetical protein